MMVAAAARNVDELDTQTDQMKIINMDWQIPLLYC